MPAISKPVIGITLDYVENAGNYNYSPLPWYALRRSYIDCVLVAGGLPLMIPFQYDMLDQIFELIDGLVVPGSEIDIYPELYGQEITSRTVSINKEKTDFEAMVMQKALDIDIPILGICNGMQLLNVLLGGTLIQHIPDRPSTIRDVQINHEQPHPEVPAHKINIMPGTILHSLAASEELSVNSTHHQAIDKVAKALIVSAKAPDGIIEAIEMKNRKFVVGVEWHPEYNSTHPLDTNLFKEFVNSCRKF